MATISAIVPTIAGVTAAPAAVNSSDKFLNDGSTILRVINGSGSSITVTIDAQSLGGVSFSDPTVTVAAGATKYIGPFRADIFNDSSGYVNVSYSATTTVTAEAIQVT